MEKKRFDSKRGYCRMLGHEVAFSYCRGVKNGLPCFKVVDCWFERFPVENFIRDNYTEAEKKLIFMKPENKITTLFDLIEKSKKHMDS